MTNEEDPKPAEASEDQVQEVDLEELDKDALINIINQQGLMMSQMQQNDSGPNYFEAVCERQGSIKIQSPQLSAAQLAGVAIEFINKSHFWKDINSDKNNTFI